MYARCLGRGNAIWMVNDDVWPQLAKLNIGNNVVFTNPVEGIKEAPNGRLLGRPS
jgi:HK97 family phage major capsid protein